MKRTYKNYSENDIREAVKSSTSIKQACIKLGLSGKGSNGQTLKRQLQLLNIDASHFKGQGWNKDNQMKDWSQYGRTKHVKIHLLKIRKNECEICGQKPIWKGKELKLELHHIDGNKCNNDLSNLQIVCPNCHSQTDNFRNRIRK